MFWYYSCLAIDSTNYRTDEDTKHSAARKLIEVFHLGRCCSLRDWATAAVSQLRYKAIFS